MVSFVLLTVLAIPGAGIPETLAKERAAVLSSVRYELEFRIPEARGEPIRGREVVRFRLAAPHRVVLDFAPSTAHGAGPSTPPGAGPPRDRLLSVSRGGRPVEFTFANNHLLIDAAHTSEGENEFTIEFLAGDDSLNRNDEFLYTLFVPARAHLAFPCFDQPDLKARYTLTLDVPEGWRAVANGAAVSGTMTAGRALMRFAETQPLPTYLFSFAAGKFQMETAARNGREFNMFHRETDAAKVARNRDAVFDLHASALAWLEEYTGIPYPFGKFDFVLIPAFQFGGMEHAGAILYNAPGLLLDESATQNQLLGRASVIAHETAHIWFGDLVTMRWFNDVWMKEVFANFMAAKIVNPSFPEVNHELRFLLSHYPGAYEIDRTAGANPIRQPLSNLSEAGQLYGAIIYQKAPIMMRQLEMLVGETAFRDGLREYLKKHAFGNATWTDLIRILDAKTSQDLAAWSRAWVEERGRPEFTVRRAGATVRLTARDPLQRGLVWPQRLRVAFGPASTGGASEPTSKVAASGPTSKVGPYKEGGAGRDNEIGVTVTRAETTVKVPESASFILANGGGLGYGLFILDERSRTWLLEHLEDIPDALTRGAAWVTLWDNLLERHLTPPAFMTLATRALPAEADEQNTQRILNYLTRAYWRFLPQQERLARAGALEQLLRDGLTRAATMSQKSAWFNAFRDMVQTPEGLEWLERVWRREEKVPGLTFAEVDEINMAMELAVRDVAGAEQILATQHERIQNPDRKARFAFVRPALSADPSVRERSFARFSELENRRREPWVLEAQAYLNHPLREEHAKRFIRPSLELLREIQRSGDIFFPKRWIDATLSGHRSADAAAMVHDFLASELQYPQRLRWTVLTAVDEVSRAAQ
jgi:aminopeptidase N